MMVMEVLASTQQNQVFEDNMQSNLTTEQSSSSASPAPDPAAAKKKRSLPGNPDPDGEVVALSPKSLMATNRFVCEVCHKGFQREQNLQLHRRGHNLPWKLSKQRPTPRKKVYVCPEASCVHHHPSRALGDLTGIKKHFSRKHGEKKHKCHKCSKKYAVHSDWKAHSKTCGTKEYKCDCGTIFSRRDSFITHRAFCDALAEESAKAIPQAQSNPYPLLLPNNCTPSFDHQQQHFSSSSSITPEMNIPPSPWLPTSASIDHTSTAEPMYPHKIENPSPLPLRLAGYQASASPHLSATALLQKAAQMGATMSRPADQNGQIMPAAHSTSNSIGFSHGSTTTTAPPHTLREVMMAGSTSNREQDFVTTTTSASVVNAVRRKDQEGGGDGLTRDFLGPRAFSHKDILSMAPSAGLPNCMTTTTTTTTSSSSFQQCQQNNSKPWHDMRSYHHEKYDVSSEFHTKHS